MIEYTSRPPPCSVCAGDPSSISPPGCVCQESDLPGTEEGEFRGLRKMAFRLIEENARLEKALAACKEDRVRSSGERILCAAILVETGRADPPRRSYAYLDRLLHRTVEVRTTERWVPLAAVDGAFRTIPGYVPTTETRLCHVRVGVPAEIRFGPHVGFGTSTASIEPVSDPWAIEGRSIEVAFVPQDSGTVRAFDDALVVASDRGRRWFWTYGEGLDGTAVVRFVVERRRRT